MAYPKARICLVEFFGGISFDLATVFQFGIKICRYYYMEKDPQTQQASMHHIMMSWQHPELLPILTMQGYQNALSNNITLLGAHDLDMIGPMDLVISGWLC
jgi:hypothetical protein